MLVPEDPVPDVPYTTRAACWTPRMMNGMSSSAKHLAHPNEVVREALGQVAVLNDKVGSISSEMEKLSLRVRVLSEELVQAKLRAEATKEAAQPQRGQQNKTQELSPSASGLRADMAIVQAELRDSTGPERGPQPRAPTWRTSVERKMRAADLMQAPEEIDRLRARLHSAMELTFSQAVGAPHDVPEMPTGRDMEAFGGEELQEALDELAQSQGRLLEHMASQANRVHRVESKIAALDEKVESVIVASDPLPSSHWRAAMPVDPPPPMPVNVPEARWNKRGRPSMFDCGGARHK